MTIGEYRDTEMGGAGGHFLTTRWSLLKDLEANDENRQKALVGVLIKSYWKPVYCYLRRKGYANERAKDLTQGFFHEIVLGRSLPQKADQSKGRFRTFLLTALDRYVTSAYRKETAEKRMPAEEIVRLDLPQLHDVPEPHSNATPEQAFHHAWAVDLLDQILHTVKGECVEGDKEVHWQVFYARLVDPILSNERPPSLTSLCARYGIEDESKASNMIITVKRRFAGVTRRYLKRVAETESEAEDELGQLLDILSGGAG